MDYLQQPGHITPAVGLISAARQSLIFLRHNPSFWRSVRCPASKGPKAPSEGGARATASSRSARRGDRTLQQGRWHGTPAALTRGPAGQGQPNGRTQPVSTRAVSPRCSRTAINNQRPLPAATGEPEPGAGFEPAGNARELARNAFLTVTVLPLGDVKSHLSEIVSRVHDHHERVTVTVHGRPSAVLIAPEDRERLEETLLLSSSIKAAPGGALPWEARPPHAGPQPQAPLLGLALSLGCADRFCLKASSRRSSARSRPRLGRPEDVGLAELDRTRKEDGKTKTRHALPMSPTQLGRETRG